MNKIFEIKMDGQRIGEVEMKKEGLYYRFQCRCQLVQPNICTITLFSNGKEHKLGICVPTGNDFCLNTRIPIKYIGEGPFAFFATVKSSAEQERFCPIDPAKGFSELALLENARLCMRNNQLGVQITVTQDQIPIQQGNDRILVHPHK